MVKKIKKLIDTYSNSFYHSRQRKKKGNWKKEVGKDKSKRGAPEPSISSADARIVKFDAVTVAAACIEVYRRPRPACTPQPPARRTGSTARARPRCSHFLLLLSRRGSSSTSSSVLAPGGATPSRPEESRSDFPVFPSPPFLAAMSELAQAELCSPGPAATATSTGKSVQVWRALASWVAILFRLLLQILRGTPSWAQLLSFVGLRHPLVFSPSATSTGYKPLAMDQPSDTQPLRVGNSLESLNRLTVRLRFWSGNYVVTIGFEYWIFWSIFVEIWCGRNFLCDIVGPEDSPGVIRARPLRCLSPWCPDCRIIIKRARKEREPFLKKKRSSFVWWRTC